MIDLTQRREEGDSAEGFQTTAGYFEPLSENDLVHLYEMINVANTQPTEHPVFRTEANYYLRVLNHVIARRYQQWCRLPAPDPKFPPNLPEPIFRLMEKAYGRYIKRLAERIETEYTEPVDRLQAIRALYYTLYNLGETNWLEQNLEAYIWQRMTDNTSKLFKSKSEWKP